MFNSVKFVFFDIDDTILDHRKAEREGLTIVYNLIPELQEKGLGTLQNTYQLINKKLWEQYGLGKITRQELQRKRFEDTLNQLGLNPDLYKSMATIYMQNYRKFWDWVPGAEKALNWIAEKYPVGFLTNGFTEVQQAKREKFSLDKYTSVYVISEEVGCMKPSACIFDYATKLTGFDPSQILYVGDSYISDIKGGKEFGWLTAWFTPEIKNGQFHADTIFNNYETLLDELK